MARVSLGIAEIVEAAGDGTATVAGDGSPVAIRRMVPLDGAGDPESLTFCRGSESASRDRLVRNGSRVAIVPDDWGEPPPGVTYVRVPDPRLAAARVLERLNPEPPEAREPAVSPLAGVSADAKIAPGVRIGPFAVVGAAEIGPGCRIAAGAFVADGSRLGAHVRIHEHATVGTIGFGFVRTAGGCLERFPQVGVAVLEDGVEVFAHANVDRGTLGETRVSAGAKIDHYAHVGHNCFVGRNTLICAHAVLAGGARVGERVFIGVGAVIREKVEVGDDAVVGANAVVIGNVPPGSTVAGVPARELPPK